MVAGSAMGEPSAAATPSDVRAFLLAVGVALTMTGDAVSEIQRHLRSIAAAYGYEDAHISVLPTYLIVLLHDGDPRESGRSTPDASCDSTRHPR